VINGFLKESSHGIVCSQKTSVVSEASVLRKTLVGEWAGKINTEDTEGTENLGAASFALEKPSFGRPGTNLARPCWLGFLMEFDPGGG
jgi:hypothetical protein